VRKVYQHKKEQTSTPNNPTKSLIAKQKEHINKAIFILEEYRENKK